MYTKHNVPAEGEHIIAVSSPRVFLNIYSYLFCLNNVYQAIMCEPKTSILLLLVVRECSLSYIIIYFVSIMYLY